MELTRESKVTIKPERTLKELAQEALDVQDACNLSGVVHGWSRSMSRLYEILREQKEFSGTDQVNHHPINQLWASKVQDLAGMGLSDYEAFSKAYMEVKQLSEEV